MLLPETSSGVIRDQAVAPTGANRQLGGDNPLWERSLDREYPNLMKSFQKFEAVGFGFEMTASARDWQVVERPGLRFHAGAWER